MNWENALRDWLHWLKNTDYQKGFVTRVQSKVFVREDGNWILEHTSRV